MPATVRYTVANMLKNNAATTAVLYLIESAGRGGAETVVSALASARGSQAYVGSLRMGWLAERMSEEKVAFETICYSPRSDLLLAYRVARLVERTRPRVVHCHCFTMNTAGALGAALAGVPSIATVHGAIYDLDTSTRRAAYRLAGMMHKRVVSVSDFLRTELHQRAGVPKGKIDVIYNGVPTPHATREDGLRARRELGFSEGDFVVGSVGMLRPEKGHADLIEAFALASEQVPNMRLILVGDGKCKDDLRSRVEQNALTDAVRCVSGCGHVPSLLTAMDVFALPSHTEGLSIATIEAMSCGTPVVVTKCGGPTEIVTDQVTGLVVPPCDPKAMADALVRLNGDPALSACLASNGRARARESFSLDGMLRSYERLYEEVAG